MNIEELRQSLPDYAKDIKINLANTLSEAGAPGLSQQQINFILLTSAYTTRNTDMIAAAIHETRDHVTGEEINAAKAAATIMAMNNIYYRFTNGLQDNAYTSLAANLRMTVLAKPGVDKISFELGCLAASILNGCTMCMNAHVAQLEKAGVSQVGIQSVARIASVINAAAVARDIL